MAKLKSSDSRQSVDLKWKLRKALEKNYIASDFSSIGTVFFPAEKTIGRDEALSIYEIYKKAADNGLPIIEVSYIETDEGLWSSVDIVFGTPSKEGTSLSGGIYFSMENIAKITLGEDGTSEFFVGSGWGFRFVETGDGMGYLEEYI